METNLINMIAVYAGLRKEYYGLDDKLLLSVNSDGSGSLLAERCDSGNTYSLLSFDNQENLVELIQQHIGLLIIDKKIKEYGLDKKE